MSLLQVGRWWRFLGREAELDILAAKSSARRRRRATKKEDDTRLHCRRLIILSAARVSLTQAENKISIAMKAADAFKRKKDFLPLPDQPGSSD